MAFPPTLSPFLALACVQPSDGTWSLGDGEMGERPLVSSTILKDGPLGQEDGVTLISASLRGSEAPLSRGWVRPAGRGRKGLPGAHPVGSVWAKGDSLGQVKTCHAVPSMLCRVLSFHMGVSSG